MLYCISGYLRIQSSEFNLGLSFTVKCKGALIDRGSEKVPKFNKRGVLN